MVDTNQLKNNIRASAVSISQTSGHALEAVASIAALFPAAYTSYLHMTQLLGYTNEPALVIAGAVELLGYMIVHAVVKAMERGRRWLVAFGSFAFGFYLVVIVLLNLILSAAEAISPTALVWAKIIAGADLALLSVPAAILAAMQSQLRAQDAKEALAKHDADSRHAMELAEKAAAEDRANKHELDMLRLKTEVELNELKLKLDAEASEKDKKRQERMQKVSTAPEKVSTPAPIVPAVVPSFPNDRRKLTHDQKVILSKMTDKEISIAANVTIKCAQNWLKAFAKEGL